MERNYEVNNQGNLQPERRNKLSCLEKVMIGTACLTGALAVGALLTPNDSYVMIPMAGTLFVSAMVSGTYALFKD